MLGALVLPLAGHAPQASDRNAPAFEVASIKPNTSRVGIRGHSFPGNRFEARNVPLRDLIMVAFGEPGRLLPESQMSGGPGWIDVDRFELGKQLRRSDDDCGAGEAGSVPSRARPDEPRRCILYVTPPGALMLRGQSMSALAYALTQTLARVVVDRTGLSGAFDADAQFNPDGLPGWAPPAPGSPNRDAPSLFGVLQEELGLKLESTRGPVDVLVIDHIEHPTPD